MEHEGHEDTPTGAEDREGPHASALNDTEEDGTLWDVDASGPAAGASADTAEGDVVPAGDVADATTMLGFDGLAADTAADGPADDSSAPEGSADEAGGPEADAAAGAVRELAGRAARWAGAHQGAAVAIGTLAALVVIAGGFALGASAVVAHVDADVAARAEERVKHEKPAEDMSLPRLGMRFTALADEAFPSVTARLSLSTADGSPLPALTAEMVALTETDDAGESSDPAVTDFSFNQGTGACQITYTADAESLGEDRTLEVSLDKASGYRGGASMGYHAFLPEEGAALDTAEWILPDSDTHRYTAAELSDLSSDELFIARNEIFARHGRMFGDSYLQRHFESTSWYEPRYSAEEFDHMKSPLNDIEIANVNTILDLEHRG